ncbi:MAG: Sec-independent protein translocase protein TatB [Alphaproteobacteria bacterium]|nr:Sec-independent protein translocase protein TatB [Alphaproteobacteria bacterium]
MLDIGWSELAVIGVVALVVIGPKELPKTLREVGKWVRSARQMAWDFQQQWEQMARDSELADVKKTIDEVRNFDLRRQVEQTIDPDGSLRTNIQDITRPVSLDGDDKAALAAPQDAPLDPLTVFPAEPRTLPEVAAAWAPPPPPPRDLPLPAAAWAPPTSA